MPKIKTNRTRKAPAGFNEIESTLTDYSNKLKDGMFNCCNRNVD